MPYLPVPDPDFLPAAGPYDHLSRRGEWTRGPAMSAETPSVLTPEAVLRRAVEFQRKAAEPRDSVWVAASAGTGKTTVLTDRFLRLLLAGCPAERLLCLTFTKAAAAEMANRIAERLALWATMEEGRLAKTLESLLSRPSSDEERELARSLFARVLDTPGGLRIMTIHAFCQALLRRFPLEAGIAPHFELLDDRGSEELLAEARDEHAPGRRRDGELAARPTRWPSSAAR